MTKDHTTIEPHYYMKHSELYQISEAIQNCVRWVCEWKSTRNKHESPDMAKSLESPCQSELT